ncbi:MAG: TraV family lipoprotein [Candidatus Omnitrophica bacterium]|nr:TraV family lipoprotein [Candidatus Omnitrophota bacterium]
MKAATIITIMGILIISSGCAGISSTTSRQSSMEKLYRHAEKQGKYDTIKAIARQLKINKALGYVKPYVPVINPPVVKRAWIVPHQTKNGALVGGYWVYIIVKKPSWYIDTPQMNIPAITIPYVNKNNNRGTK